MERESGRKTEHRFPLTPELFEKIKGDIDNIETFDLTYHKKINNKQLYRKQYLSGDCGYLLKSDIENIGENSTSYKLFEGKGPICNELSEKTFLDVLCAYPDENSVINRIIHLKDGSFIDLCTMMGKKTYFYAVFTITRKEYIVSSHYSKLLQNGSIPSKDAILYSLANDISIESDYKPATTSGKNIWSFLDKEKEEYNFWKFLG